MFFDKVSLVTGGFDPIHSGHISYFKRAKDLSNYLVVGINTEEWLTRKKGQYFQSWKERAEIIRHLETKSIYAQFDIFRRTRTRRGSRGGVPWSLCDACVGAGGGPRPI